MPTKVPEPKAQVSSFWSCSGKDHGLARGNLLSQVDDDLAIFLSTLDGKIIGLFKIIGKIAICSVNPSAFSLLAFV